MKFILLISMVLEQQIANGPSTPDAKQ